MKQDQALNVLIEAVRKANKAGAYILEESELIAAAVKVFTTPVPKVEEPEAVPESE